MVEVDRDGADPRASADLQTLLCKGDLQTDRNAATAARQTEISGWNLAESVFAGIPRMYIVLLYDSFLSVARSERRENFPSASPIET